MNIYAISDLHLSTTTNKPMDVFGTHWENHFEKIKNDWLNKVKADDVVLVPGDISWGMNLSEAKPDIDALCALPGKKLLLRGNHDYWWSSLNKVNSILSNDTHVLQNNCVDLGEYVIVGSRGWTVPGERSDKQDIAIFERELIRLKMSLDDAASHAGTKIAMLHFPPFDEQRHSTIVTKMLSEAGVKYAVYGHLHSKSFYNAFCGEMDGVAYALVSADYLDFKLKFIL